MDLEQVFSAASFLAMAGWLLLVFLPGWRWTTAFVTSVLIPSILAVAYLTLFLMYWGSNPDGFSAFNTLAGVKKALSIDGMLMAGWIHYLCFDLFIGSWEVRDARRFGVNHLLVIPCLALTLMMGPVGLLAYLVLRFAVRRRWTIETTAPADVQPSS